MICPTVFILLLGLVKSRSSQECAVYNELESFAPCGRSGYALQYGLPNCERFVEREWLYTPFGKSFLNCTRNCLINFIQTEIIAKNVTNCETINTQAFGSHVPCYTNCGFCLSKQTMPVVLDALLTNPLPLALTYRISDFLSFIALEQVAQVAASCIPNPFAIIDLQVG